MTTNRRQFEARIYEILKYQASDYVHQLTCPEDSMPLVPFVWDISDKDTLVLRCPICDYEQTHIPHLPNPDEMFGLLPIKTETTVLPPATHKLKEKGLIYYIGLAIWRLLGLALLVLFVWAALTLFYWMADNMLLEGGKASLVEVVEAQVSFVNSLRIR